jgi:energy-converting hydrogenase Eha subunit E
VSALVGWYLKRNLTILDAEHAVALVTGIAAVRVHTTIVLRRSRLVARNA